jgi:hypothetical protein
MCLTELITFKMWFLGQIGRKAFFWLEKQSPQHILMKEMTFESMIFSPVVPPGKMVASKKEVEIS